MSSAHFNNGWEKIIFFEINLYVNSIANESFYHTSKGMTSPLNGLNEHFST